jgi:hypothetical protein
MTAAGVLDRCAAWYLRRRGWRVYSRHRVRTFAISFAIQRWLLERVVTMDAQDTILEAERDRAAGELGRVINNQGALVHRVREDDPLMDRIEHLSLTVVMPHPPSKQS